MDSKIEILFARYFSGEATEKELRELENYLAESTEHEAYFNEMTKLYEQAAISSPQHHFDSDKATSDFKEYIRKDKTIKLTPQRNVHFFKYTAVAAVAIIAIGLFFLFETNQSSDGINIIADAQSAKTVTLFDHVKVDIEQGSKLTYRKDAPNEPELSGKATFAVTQKTDKQLTIKAGNTYIRDIGTVFTVDATSPSDSVTVKVTEGEVMFYTKNNRGISVKKGQSGVYYSQTDLFKYREEKQLPDEFVFKNMSLAEIIPQLESNYGITVHLQSESVKQLRMNANFDKRESADAILNIIAETLSLHISKNNNGEYILSKQ